MEIKTLKARLRPVFLLFVVTFLKVDVAFSMMEPENAWPRSGGSSKPVRCIDLFASSIFDIPLNNSQDTSEQTGSQLVPTQTSTALFSTRTFDASFVREAVNDKVNTMYQTLSNLVVDAYENARTISDYIHSESGQTLIASSDFIQDRFLVPQNLLKRYSEVVVRMKDLQTSILELSIGEKSRSLLRSTIRWLKSKPVPRSETKEETTANLDTQKLEQVIEFLKLEEESKKIIEELKNYLESQAQDIQTAKKFVAVMQAEVEVLKELNRQINEMRNGDASEKNLITREIQKKLTSYLQNIATMKAFEFTKKRDIETSTEIKGQLEGILQDTLPKLKTSDLELYNRAMEEFKNPKNRVLQIANEIASVRPEIIHQMKLFEEKKGVFPRKQKIIEQAFHQLVIYLDSLPEGDLKYEEAIYILKNTSTGLSIFEAETELEKKIINESIVLIGKYYETIGNEANSVMQPIQFVDLYPTHVATYKNYEPIVILAILKKLEARDSNSEEVKAKMDILDSSINVTLKRSTYTKNFSASAVQAINNVIFELKRKSVQDIKTEIEKIEKEKQEKIALENRKKEEAQLQLEAQIRELEKELLKKYPNPTPIFRDVVETAKNGQDLDQLMIYRHLGKLEYGDVKVDDLLLVTTILPNDIYYDNIAEFSKEDKLENSIFKKLNMREWSEASGKQKRLSHRILLQMYAKLDSRYNDINLKEYLKLKARYIVDESKLAASTEGYLQNVQDALLMLINAQLDKPIREEREKKKREEDLALQAKIEAQKITAHTAEKLRLLQEERIMQKQREELVQKEEQKRKDEIAHKEKQDRVESLKALKNKRRAELKVQAKKLTQNYYKPKEVSPDLRKAMQLALKGDPIEQNLSSVYEQLLKMESLNISELLYVLIRTPRNNNSTLQGNHPDKIRDLINAYQTLGKDFILENPRNKYLNYQIAILAASLLKEKVDSVNISKYLKLSLWDIADREEFYSENAPEYKTESIKRLIDAVVNEPLGRQSDFKAVLGSPKSRIEYLEKKLLEKHYRTSDLHLSVVWNKSQYEILKLLANRENAKLYRSFGDIIYLLSTFPKGVKNLTRHNDARLINELSLLQYKIFDQYRLDNYGFGLSEALDFTILMYMFYGVKAEMNDADAKEAMEYIKLKVAEILEESYLVKKREDGTGFYKDGFIRDVKIVLDKLIEDIFGRKPESRGGGMMKRNS